MGEGTPEEEWTGRRLGVVEEEYDGVVGWEGWKGELCFKYKIKSKIQKWEKEKHLKQKIKLKK